MDALWHEVLLNTEVHDLVCAQLLGGAVVKHSTRFAQTTHENDKIRNMARSLTAMHALTGRQPLHLKHWKIPGYELRCIKVTRGLPPAPEACISRPCDVKAAIKSAFGTVPDMSVRDVAGAVIPEDLTHEEHTDHPAIGAVYDDGSSSHTVTVSKMTGTKTSLNVRPGMSVHDLMLAIQADQGIQMPLIYSRTQLSPDGLLMTYGIRDGADIHLPLRLIGC